MNHAGIRIEEDQVYNIFEAGDNFVALAPHTEFDSLVGVVEDQDGMHIEVVYADTLQALINLAAQQ